MMSRAAYVMVVGLCIWAGLFMISAFLLGDYAIAVFENEQWVLKESGAFMLFESLPLAAFCVLVFGSFVGFVAWLIFDIALDRFKNATEKALIEKHTNVLTREKNCLESQKRGLEYEFAKYSQLQNEAVGKMNQALEIKAEAEAMQKRSKNAMAAAERIKRKLDKIKSNEIVV